MMCRATLSGTEETHRQWAYNFVVPCCVCVHVRARVHVQVCRAGQEGEPAQEQATAAKVCYLQACRLVTARRKGTCV